MLKILFAYYFLKLHLHHFSKIKIHKEVTKQQDLRVFLLFFLDNRWIRSRRRIQIRIRIWYYWIRIRFQEAQKHTDPTDPDPQH